MYLEHFDLKQAPFSSLPDSQLLPNLNNSDTLFIELIKSVNSPESAIFVEGSSGYGKSSVCRKFLNALRAHKRYAPLELQHSNIPRKDLFISLAEQIGLRADDTLITFKRIKAELKGLKSREKRVVLVIDNAEALPKKTRKTVLKLAAKTYCGERLIRVVMFFNNDVKSILEESEEALFRQCKGRYLALTKINDGAVGEYLEKKLKLAGASDSTYFTASATRLIGLASDGCPRVINSIAHKAMISAYRHQRLSIDKEEVQEAIAEIGFIRLPSKKSLMARIRTQLFGLN